MKKGIRKVNGKKKSNKIVVVIDHPQTDICSLKRIEN